MCIYIYIHMYSLFIPLRAAYATQTPQDIHQVDVVFVVLFCVGGFSLVSFLTGVLSLMISQIDI